MTDVTPRRDGRQRDDASVSLLRSLTEDALDPDYARASKRPTTAASDTPRPVSSVKARIAAFIVLALAGLLITLAALDLRAVLVPQSQQARAALVERVVRGTEEADARQAQVEQLRREVNDLSAQGDGAADDERFALDVASATTAVTGPGLEVTLDNAERSPSADDGPDLGRVLDRDLQEVANGLWAAGAEAVTINDQRLTALTAIRSAGQAILVNYRPLSPPYVVAAIGDSSEMEEAFTQGPAGLSLRTLRDTYGLQFSTSQQRAIDMPAGSAAILRNATPIPGTEVPS